MTMRMNAKYDTPSFMFSTQSKTFMLEVFFKKVFFIKYVQNNKYVQGTLILNPRSCPVSLEYKYACT